MLLAFHRNEVADLLKRLDNFWKIQDIKITFLRNDCEDTIRNLKTISLSYACFSFVVMTSFIVKPFFTTGQTLALNTYLPQSMTYQHMLAVQTYFCLVLCFSIAGLDFLVCTLCVYLQIQYKILNYNVQILNIGEIRTTHEEKLCHTKLIKYIKHHDFLLR